ncbi:MAG: ABC transporter substrate-binding protein [Candidatus Bathyarchaeota archaeon]|nr:ABC transporter substrate-binding protein [Candidatus Bathyarchaeum sp.]
MDKRVIIAIILSIIIVSSVLVAAFSLNWFGEEPETPEAESPEGNENPENENPETETPENENPETSSDMELILEVYGNADMDDKIDADDVAYLQDIIAGNSAETQFADANHDGTIDQTDVDQVNAIINSEATYITLLDGNGELLTVSLPVERIAVEYLSSAELVRILDLQDSVVGIDYAVDQLRSFYFPDNNDIECIGQMYTPDYEAVLNVDPDVLLTFSESTEEKTEKLPGVDVVYLGLYYPNVTAPEDSSFVQGILKAGYIFDRVTEAREYVTWILDLTDTLSSVTSNLAESEKPSVFITNYPYSESASVKLYAPIDTLGQVCILAGGANIGETLDSYWNSSAVTVDAEWLIEANPEYMFLHTVQYTYSGVAMGDPNHGYNIDDATSIMTCIEDYMSQPAFANIDAVKNGNVYIMAGDFRNNAMGGTLGAVYMAKILHPEEFADLDPEAIQQKYITEFMGLDYSLDEHGVFLYPAINKNGDLSGIPDSYANETESPEPEPTIDITLEVFGNADMDDNLDNDDVEYLQAIIDGSSDATEFADANNDGTIDATDIEQVNALLDGDATYITLLDGNGELLTVSLPVDRIIVEYLSNAEMVRILELEDNVVGCDYAVEQLKDFYFPENGENIVNVGKMNSPDYEAVLDVNPDLVLTFTKATEEKAEKLPGVDVVYLGLYYPNVTAPEDSSFVQGILKAGYIFDRVEQSREYVNWLLNITDTISSVAGDLDETEKNTVFITTYPYDSSATTFSCYATVDTLGQCCILSGGSNVGQSLTGYFNSSSVKVDAEWILEANPEYMFLHTVRYTYGGSMRNDPAQGYNVDNITSIQTCLEEFMSRPEFANIDAVQNDNVYIIAGDFRNNAMGGTLGAVYMANVLYPDLFTDLNPEAVHQEYITRFLRLDYSLDEQGVFLYPALNVDGNLIGVPETAGD